MHQALALKTILQGGTKDADRIRFAFRCCLTRQPTAEETQRLTELLVSQRERIDPENSTRPALSPTSWVDKR